MSMRSTKDLKDIVSGVRATYKMNGIGQDLNSAIASDKENQGEAESKMWQLAKKYQSSDDYKVGGDEDSGKVK